MFIYEGPPLDMEQSQEPTPISEDELRGIQPGFEVRDDDSAEWVVGKILASRRKQEEIKQRAERMIESARHEEDFFLARFGESLETFARAQIAKAGTRGGKTHRLLSGYLGFTSRAASLAIADADKLMLFAEECIPQAIKTVPERRAVAKDAVNRALVNFTAEEVTLRGTGEVVALESTGLSFVPGGEAFRVSEAPKPK